MQLGCTCTGSQSLTPLVVPLWILCTRLASSPSYNNCSAVELVVVAAAPTTSIVMISHCAAVRKVTPWLVSAPQRTTAMSAGSTPSLASVSMAAAPATTTRAHGATLVCLARPRRNP
jgi:hypothetical protein